MSDEVFEALNAAALARFIERNEERDNGGEGSSRYDRHERYRELDAALGDVGHRERRRVSLQLGRDFNHAIHRRHLSPNSRLVQEQESLTSSSRPTGGRQDLERREREHSSQSIVNRIVEILCQRAPDRRGEREEQGFGNGSNVDTPD